MEFEQTKEGTRMLQSLTNTFGYDSKSTLCANEQFHGIETSGGPS
jgi:hypothetical protein